MSQYLVTGGAGFIGSHIVHRLVGQGCRVRVVDNLSTGNIENLRSVQNQIEFHEACVSDAAAMRRAVSGVEVVFHQAALASVPLSMAEPVKVHEACTTGTLTVLDAAKKGGVRRVVYAGSSSAYGDTPQMHKREDQMPSMLSPYAASKLAGELYCQAYAASLGLETVRLRYFNVFGPRQDPQSPYSAAIPLFVTALLNGRRPRIFGDGTQSRDFVFVENVVDANRLAATAKRASGGVFNIGSGESITIGELLKGICEILDVEFDPVYEAARAGDVMHSCADITAAGRELDYRPATPFHEGLRKTVEYYAEETRAKMGVKVPAISA